MVEVKKKEQEADSGVFDTFFSLNDLAQISGVLTATERLSELADAMDTRFGETELCREVIRGVRSAITAIYAMGGVLYSVPLAQRMLVKYDVKLSTWTRFRIGARFYARRMVVMWILASMLSASAAILLVARFAAASYGVVMGTVPVAALGYLAAAIGGVCLPLAACVYMLRQIGFVYARFVESVKVARAVAYDQIGVDVIDDQEDHLPSAYFVHSVSDYDLRKSRQLVWASSACLTISIVSLCVAFLLEAVFPLKSSAVVGAGPTLTLWYDFVVVGLSFMVGALLVVCGSSKFLHDKVALEQLRRAILEAVDAKVSPRRNATIRASRQEYGEDADGIELRDITRRDNAYEIPGTLFTSSEDDMRWVGSGVISRSHSDSQLEQLRARPSASAGVNAQNSLVGQDEKVQVITHSEGKNPSFESVASAQEVELTKDSCTGEENEVRLQEATIEALQKIQRATQQLA